MTRFLPFLLLILASPLWALDQPFDHSTWDRLLAQFVDDQGQVDFPSLQKDPSLLDEYLGQIARIEGVDFTKRWPREEKLALWLNAYHAGVLKTVLDHYPVKSIQDIPGVWDTDFIQVAGRFYSLNDIRARHLMGTYRDEKIHTALACGAVSCPRLRKEAFQGPRVEGQLFLAAREFVNDLTKNQIDPSQRKIKLSTIFKWYAGDFKLDFGRFENDRGLSQNDYAVLSFVAHYLEDVKKVQYLEEGEYKISYLPFNWGLVEKKG